MDALRSDFRTSSYHTSPNVSWGHQGPFVTATSIDGVTDIVSIRDLQVSTVIGVYDWEREIEQALTFSVDMAGDVARAASPR